MRPPRRATAREPTAHRPRTTGRATTPARSDAGAAQGSAGRGPLIRLIRKGAHAAREAALLLRDAGLRWSGDACYRMGSSLAFAGLFSIFPLLLLAITAFGVVLGHDAAVRHRIVASVAGATSAEFQTLLDQTLASMQTHRKARGVGAAVGAVTLLVGASGVFADLQASLNVIWRVSSPPSAGFLSTLLGMLKARAFSFLVVVFAAFAIFAELVASTALVALRGAAGKGAAGSALWEMLEIAISIGSLTLLIATVYRIVPMTRVAWGDVFPGAVLTAAAFTAVKNLLAWYFDRLGNYAAYGAVGAVLGLLTWIYVASVLVLYGAEFSRVFAERFGSLASADGAGKEGGAPSRHPGE